VTVPTGPPPADEVGVTHHADPRARHRREFAPPIDALAAAVRLEEATASMRARALEGGPAAPVEDEPPTGLIDLAALRAAVGASTPGDDVDPAAAAWLAGGPDPDAARVLERLEALEPPAPRVEVPPSPAPAAAVAVPPSSSPPPAPVVVPRVFRSEREPRPGWASRHDARSLAFGVRDHLGAAPLQDVTLPIGPVLDQGQEGECVGCGVVDATNVLRRLTGRADMLKVDAAAALYHRAQQIDDVPGENYAGTSVLAGMRAGVEAGYFTSYLWAFGTRDIASALAHGRPVVVGVPWPSGMYDTGPGGLVQVGGDDRGEGHCLTVFSLRMTGPQGQPGPWFGWLNSWGKSYGADGVGWVHHRDLAGLLHGFGEAAVPSLGPA
jgi:hypothetical protein